MEDEKDLVLKKAIDAQYSKLKHNLYLEQWDAMEILMVKKFVVDHADDCKDLLGNDFDQFLEKTNERLNKIESRIKDYLTRIEALDAARK